MRLIRPVNGGVRKLMMPIIDFGLNLTQSEELRATYFNLGS